MFIPRRFVYLLSMTVALVFVTMSYNNCILDALYIEGVSVLAAEPIKSEEEILEEADREFREYRETWSDPDYNANFDPLRKLNYTQYIGREHYTFVNGGVFRAYLRRREYDKAVEYLREQLKLLKPWNSRGLRDNMNEESHYNGYQHSGPAFHLILKQLGLALELNGQYEEALNVYMAVYSSDDLLWAKTRILYRVNLMKQEDPNFKLSDALEFELYDQNPFSNVVYIVNTIMPTIPIDEVLESVKEYQAILQERDHDYPSLGGGGYLPVPDDQNAPDALAAYRFRDNCARIMCPSLDPAAVLTDEKERYVFTTRIAYAEFLKYAEEEYQLSIKRGEEWEKENELIVTHFNVRWSSKKRLEKTMNLLRKIGELPY